MAQSTKAKKRRINGDFQTARELDQLLDNFQALDRTVVETFMQIYDTPLPRQAAFRNQNRRLHAAISKPLRRILSHNTGVGRKK